MYVAVKGGEKAIRNAHKLFANKRRGDANLPGMSVEQIVNQLSFAVSRVMAEGALFDTSLAAIAIRQAQGDLIEAIFLVRAYRTTLPRFGFSQPVETRQMNVARRVSATYKDLPGGQILGPTFDYSHRLIDFELDADAPVDAPEKSEEIHTGPMPRVTDLIGEQGMMEPDPQAEPDAEIADLTREPLSYPAGRDLRLQGLARGDEGFLLSLGYSTQRGFGGTHPFVGEIRMGDVEVSMFAPEIGFDVPIGRITVTECQMVNQFKGSAKAKPKFTRGYGLVFGHSERKAMAMSLVDRALRWEELGEEKTAPAQDEEFVLSHADNIQASGFVEHLKLPHYVDFQAELELIRTMHKEISDREAQADAKNQEAAE